MDKAEELINKEIDFTPERTDNAPYVITKLECRILMKQYAQQRENEVFKKGWKAAEKLNNWNANKQEDE